MRRRLLSITIIILILFSVPVYGDTGPKPSITVKGINMPDELCYMDLLISDDDSNTYNNYDNLQNPDQYNLEMLDLIRNHGISGWHPARTHRRAVIGDYDQPHPKGFFEVRNFAVVSVKTSI